MLHWWGDLNPIILTVGQLFYHYIYLREKIKARQSHWDQCDQTLELKVAQFHQSCPKSSQNNFYNKREFFKVAQKVVQYFGLILLQNISQKPFKSSPIWSHWLRPKRYWSQSLLACYNGILSFIDLKRRWQWVTLASSSILLMMMMCASKFLKNSFRQFLVKVRLMYIHYLSTYIPTLPMYLQNLRTYITYIPTKPTYLHYLHYLCTYITYVPTLPMYLHYLCTYITYITYIVHWQYNSMRVVVHTLS